jgi:hypothetical protein
MTNDKDNINNEMIQEDIPGQNNNMLSNVDDSTQNNESSPEMQSGNTDRDVIQGTNATNDNGGNSGLTLTSDNDDELEDLLTDSAPYPVTIDDPEIEAVQDLNTQEQNELLNYLENAQL